MLGGFEMLACVRTDPTFGPVIRFGQGVPGLAPVGEVAAALPPLSPRLARAMLQETGLGRLILAGDNPRLPDAEAVACVLVRLAQLVVDRAEIVAVDLEFAFTGEAGLRTVLANVEVAPWPAGVDPASRLAVRPYPAELERRMRSRTGARCCCARSGPRTRVPWRAPSAGSAPTTPASACSRPCASCPSSWSPG